MDTLSSLALGFLIGLILLVFFMDEIFAGIDHLRDKVRRALHLAP